METKPEIKKLGLDYQFRFALVFKGVLILINCYA